MKFFRIFLVLMVLVSGLVSASSLAQTAQNQTGQPASPPADPGMPTISDPAVPGDATTQPANLGPENNNATEYLEGTITKLLPLPAGSKDQGRDLEVKLNNGETVRVIDSEGKFKAGQDIEVFKTLGPDSDTVYYATDYIRRLPIGILVAVFVIIATVVGRGKGFRAVLGMFACIAMIMLAIVPAIAAGYNPILCAILGASLILTISVYFVHGVNITSSAALAATIVSAAITLGLAELFSQLSRLSGFGQHDALFLQSQGLDVDVYALMIAGMLIGSLGALVDSTVAQAAVVRELANLNPQMRGRDLYQSAMAVGFDHIGSLINTLVLAYAGASLPLFVLIRADQMTVGRVLNLELIATEIVHALVGSIGLILAVPIATFLAAVLFVGSRFPGVDNVHTHVRARPLRTREQLLADALGTPSREGSRLMDNPRAFLDDAQDSANDPSKS
jgi:uncharacterized membrane protein